MSKATEMLETAREFMRSNKYDLADKIVNELYESETENTIILTDRERDRMYLYMRMISDKLYMNKENIMLYSEAYNI